MRKRTHGKQAGIQPIPAGLRLRAIARSALLLPLLALIALPAAALQAAPPTPAGQLPDAPQPQSARPDAPIGVRATAPCKAAGAAQPCPTARPTNWFARFLNGPQVKPLTPKEKAHLAARNLLDPFNGLTILGEAGIAIGANSHSPYGPGWPGFGRYVGVSFTQDMTGEFFGTFLIPSLVHQDPHYHRMPRASVPRRFLHAITQVAWTQGDNGRGMLNYANLAGFAITDEIGNLYVPGRETNAEATAARYGIGLATAPIDNFLTEFVPDVARHIHIRIVLVQRVIDQVAKSEGGSAP